MSLSDEIQQCKKCVEIGCVSVDRLNTRDKPYFLFDVDKKWKPDRMKVLFWLNPRHGMVSNATSTIRMKLIIEPVYERKF